MWCEMQGWVKAKGFPSWQGDPLYGQKRDELRFPRIRSPVTCQVSLEETTLLGVVFKSPVQSGFWTLIRCNCNHNRFGLHPQVRKTGLNHIQLVQIGPVVVTQLISTGCIQERSQPVETSWVLGLNMSRSNTILATMYIK